MVWLILIVMVVLAVFVLYSNQKTATAERWGSAGCAGMAEWDQTRPPRHRDCQIVPSVWRSLAPVVLSPYLSRHARDHRPALDRPG